MEGNPLEQFLNENEQLPQITPEELQEMLKQIPTLKEMLQEWKEELGRLENDPEADPARLEELGRDIPDLEEEIRAREELGGLL